MSIFHDGYLTGISLGERSACLGLKTDTGERYELDLIGVHRLRADDFRQGNIILDLEVITGRAPPVSEFNRQMERLDETPSADVAPSYHDARSSRIEKIFVQIVAGETTLVIVNPTYGCDLVALCSSAVLRGPHP
jgi:hypothetical protein